MDFESDFFQTFFGELMESYRHKIMERSEVKELTRRQMELSREVRKNLYETHPEVYEMVTELTGGIFDISGIKQEQLYIQGVKDGIRVKKLVEEIEKGEAC